MNTVQTLTDREPTHDQADELNGLALQYDALGCAWIGDVIVVACFAVNPDEVGIEIDRFRVLPNGFALGIPEGHEASRLTIDYPQES